MSDNRTILITGATGVVGSELVRHFLSAGDTVVATAYDEAPGAVTLRALAEEVATNRLHTVSLDFEEESALDDLMTFLEDRGLRPTGLVNGARNLNHLKLNEFNRPLRESWLGEFRLDVSMAYELTMALAEHTESQLESVVSISSMYGLVPPNPSLYEDFSRQSPIHYGVIKAAQIQLTRELAVRLAKRNVRVNAVSLGGVRGRADKPFEMRYATLCPQGRMLEKNEVVGAVDFLLSGGASAVTGHNLVVDGGWTVW